MTPDKYICANAGDSRVILSKMDGSVVPLSEDHKPDNPGELARIEAGGGYVAEGRVCGNLSLSRAFGDFHYKQNVKKDYKNQLITVDPEIITVDRKPDEDDFLVLACDGIWDCLDNEECSQNLKNNMLKSCDVDKPGVNGAPALNLSKSVADMFDEIICEDPTVAKTTGIGADNMTCILVNLSGTDNKQSNISSTG